MLIVEPFVQVAPKLVLFWPVTLTVVSVLVILVLGMLRCVNAHMTRGC